jgi:hypothetical protein
MFGRFGALDPCRIHVRLSAAPALSIPAAKATCVFLTLISLDMRKGFKGLAALAGSAGPPPVDEDLRGMASGKHNGAHPRPAFSRSVFARDLARWLESTF